MVFVCLVLWREKLIVLYKLLLSKITIKVLPSIIFIAKAFTLSNCELDQTCFNLIFSLLIVSDFTIFLPRLR